MEKRTNLKVYYDHTNISIRLYDTSTFLRRWENFNWKTFKKLYSKKYEIFRKKWAEYMDKQESLGRDFRDIIRDKECDEIEDKYNPYRYAKLAIFLVKIPLHIEIMFICGPKIFIGREQFTHKLYFKYPEKHHLLDKLYAYYNGWEGYKFTAWDKLRFKIVTGKKFVEDR